MMILFLLVLHSGFLQFIFTTNRLRSFRETERQRWNDSQKNCRATGESLITLHDQDDAEFVIQYLQKGDPNNPSVWLGLHRDRINVTTWLNGKVPKISGLTIPSEVSTGELRCGAAESGKWTAYACSGERKFMCQKDENYTLINEEKNWWEAMQYCRRHFTNLAIIDDEQEAEHVLNIYQSNSFWIGLLHDEWQWVDQSCSTYRNWGKENVLENCSVITNGSGTVMNRFNCDSDAIGLCSKGSVRIIVSTLELTWEEALSYCEANHSRFLWIEDEEDQNAVKQWLNYTIQSRSEDSYPLWISMRQSSVFGFWIWSDRIVNWANWEDGRQPELDKPFQCGVINKNFTWSNEDCSKKLPFLCEEDIVWMNK